MYTTCGVEALVETLLMFTVESPLFSAFSICCADQYNGTAVTGWITFAGDAMLLVYCSWFDSGCTDAPSETRLESIMPSLLVTNGE